MRLLREPTTSPRLVRALNTVVVLLLLVLLGNIAFGVDDVHTYVMLALSIGLLVSLNWCGRVVPCPRPAGQRVGSTAPPPRAGSSGSSAACSPRRAAASRRTRASGREAPAGRSQRCERAPHPGGRGPRTTASLAWPSGAAAA